MCFEKTASACFRESTPPFRASLGCFHTKRFLLSSSTDLQLWESQNFSMNQVLPSDTYACISNISGTCFICTYLFLYHSHGQTDSKSWSEEPNPYREIKNKRLEHTCTSWKHCWICSAHSWMNSCFLSYYASHVQKFREIFKLLAWRTLYVKPLTFSDCPAMFHFTKKLSLQILCRFLQTDKMKMSDKCYHKN